MINDVKYIESDILTFHNNMDVFKIHTNQLFKYKNQLYNCIKYNKNIVFDTNYLLLATIQDSNIITNDNIKTNDIICLYPDKNDVFTLFYTKSQLDMMKRFSPGYDG